MAEQIAAVEPGDLVKIVIRSIPPSRKWDAERLWVNISSVNGDRMTGRLDNDPSDFPHLPRGSKVAFERHNIIDIILNEPEKRGWQPAQPRREFWERCIVEKCVSEGHAPVGFLYREEPNMTREGDAQSDSGWRIFGDIGNCGDEVLADRPIEWRLYLLQTLSESGRL